MDTIAVKKDLLESYQKTFGNVSYACRTVNIARSTYYKWLEEDPEFKQAIIDIEPKEALVDSAELQLAKKINEGDTASIIFTLKTLGKKRGYIERTEQEVRSHDSDTVIIEWQ